MGRGAAEHPLALPGGGLDGVVGDRSDDGEAHAAGQGSRRGRAGSARASRRHGAMAIRSRAHASDPADASSAARRCSSSSRSIRRVPGAGEVLIEVTHAGVNFADTHQRRNEYLAAAELPLIPGAEVAGVREDTGERVVALTGGRGGYARVRDRARGAHLRRSPTASTTATALALLLQGLTAWHLLRTSARARGGRERRRPRRRRRHRVAGRAARRAPFGAGRVIATASTRGEARARARARRRRGDRRRAPRAWPSGCIEANGGAPVDVVLETIGGEVFDAVARGARAVRAARHLRHRRAGKTNAPNTRKLMRASRAVVGFWFRALPRAARSCSTSRSPTCSRAPRAASCAPSSAPTYPLEQAAQAQIDLAERRTTGKVLLDPSALRRRPPTSSAH